MVTTLKQFTSTLELPDEEFARAAARAQYMDPVTRERLTQRWKDELEWALWGMRSPK